ncbi:hypothetical protein, partial [Halobacillus faecis]|uniref:hypothetical protein n=1 Tax=Halobacillus faecis TaxID=360184 RepID=UPI0011BEFA04
MNTAMMTMLGHSQKMFMNPNVKQKEEVKGQETLFGSLLGDLQGISTITNATKQSTEEMKESFLKLIGKIEAMISNLVEQGEAPNGDGLDWEGNILRAKT